jgi:anhydro-N-acetylmuramic acid kinase
MAWFIGLMSGTSLDGVDGVLARQVDDSALPEVEGHVRLELPGPLREALLALNHPGVDELHRGALAANALMAVYADAVTALLQARGLERGAVAAIGAHGQTVRHRPGAFDGTGYTVQLMNGALLAERCGIDVVCDFRSRDLAAGGQGAPLVPAFHAARFARPGIDRAVLNLGGIANLSLLGAEGTVRGFDCGPGNLLMDGWCRRHQGLPYDRDGRWAATGVVDASLLGRLLADPYFERKPPKSTGRDEFNADWLAAGLSSAGCGDPIPQPRDVMATLAELTVRSVTQALAWQAPRTTDLLVCGGGAFNLHLMQRLRALLDPRIGLLTTAEEGVPPDQVEAAAFAWLASAFVGRRTGNLPAVTGARAGRVLGALYPAA